MPFYYILVRLKNGNVHKGVRENQNTFIDRVWEEYYGLACKSYGAGLVNFICVQISKNSQEYKDFKARLKKNGST